MKYVYFSSIRPDEDRREATLLKGLSESCNSEKYGIVQNPKQADIILLTDVIYRDFGKLIIQNYMINKYPNKCFLISMKDNPITLFRGIYASAEKSIFNFGRIHNGAYNTYPMRNYMIDNYNIGGGNSKKYLFSFIGANSHPIRKRIFEMKFRSDDIYIVDSSKNFNLWNERNTLKGQTEYVETLLSSKFSLCPRGAGANSIRLFESMKLGVAPIIVSDEWIFPSGPDWEKFSIIIKYKQIHLIENIVRSYEDKWEEMGELAKEAYSKYFDDNSYFDYLIDNCVAIQQNQLIPESFYFNVVSRSRFFCKKVTGKVKNILKKALTIVLHR